MNLLIGELVADQRRNKTGGQRNRLRRNVGGARDRTHVISGSAGEVDEQLHNTTGRNCSDERVDPAFEPAGCFTRQLVTTSRACDRHGVEVSGLDEHVRGRVRNLSGESTHHTGETDRPRAVSDQQIFGVERAHLLVERGELLPRLRAPNDDAAGELVEVVAVNRLAEFEHHVVRDVHNQRNRSDARKTQPPAHPCRSRPRGVNTAHHTSHENRTTESPANRRLVVNGNVKRTGKALGYVRAAVCRQPPGRVAKRSAGRV